jgi:hypothetical protein
VAVPVISLLRVTFTLFFSFNTKEEAASMLPREG